MIIIDSKKLSRAVMYERVHRRGSTRKITANVIGIPYSIMRAVENGDSFGAEHYYKVLEWLNATHEDFMIDENSDIVIGECLIIHYQDEHRHRKIRRNILSNRFEQPKYINKVKYMYHD